MKSDLHCNSRLHSLYAYGIQGMVLLCLISLLSATNLVYAGNNQGDKATSELKQSINTQSLKIKSHESDLRQIQSNQKKCTAKIRKIDGDMKVIEKKTAVLSTQAELLTEEREDLKKQLEEQENKLALLLKKTFMIGRNSTIKLFLNNEDPGINDRYLTYTSYLAHERKNLIHAISQKREELKIKNSQLTLKQQELDNLKDNYSELKLSLISEKNKQDNYETELRVTLDEERKQLQETSIALGKLENELAKKQKELEEKRRIQAKKLAMLRAQQKQKKVANTQAATENKVTANELTSRNGLTRKHGALPWPTKGSVIHSFGEKRSGEISWKGLVISASSGQSVKAIGDGDCLYSGWLNGLGNIVVIDHGRGFLSLYGNNKSLSVKAGQSVKEGQQIAVVGNSGSFKTNSLYFEIRYEGIPVDPRKWLARR